MEVNDPPCFFGGCRSLQGNWFYCQNTNKSLGCKQLRKEPYFCQKVVMVTEQEKVFVEWWARNRDREKKLFRQWLIGLPVGLLFAVPIVLNFSSGWHKR